VRRSTSRQGRRRNSKKCVLTFSESKHSLNNFFHELFPLAHRLLLRSTRLQLGQKPTTLLAMSQCVLTPSALNAKADLWYLPQSKAGCDAIIAEFRQHESKLHVLINNSGVTWGGQFDDFPEEKGWDNVFAVNVKSIFYSASFSLVPS